MIPLLRVRFAEYVDTPAGKSKLAHVDKSDALYYKDGFVVFVVGGQHWLVPTTNVTQMLVDPEFLKPPEEPRGQTDESPKSSSRTQKKSRTRSKVRSK